MLISRGIGGGICCGSSNNQLLLFEAEGPPPVFQTANAVQDLVHGCSHNRWIDGRQVLPKGSQGFLPLGLLGIDVLNFLRNLRKSFYGSWIHLPLLCQIEKEASYL